MTTIQTRINSQNRQQTLQTFDPDLFSLVRRNLNSLKQKQAHIRKSALQELLKIFKEKELPGALFEEIGHMGLKDILQCFSDHSEACRQLSTTIVIEMLPRATKINPFLPYIFSILIDRTNCHDLEGITNVPQKMRPPPGQKPKVIIKIVQNCEEIRLLYCSLLRKILSLLEHQGDQIRKYLDDLINLTRALIMDPAPEVQKTACQTLELICRLYKDILLHYTEIMGRAVLLPLISKKSKIRIAGLKTLTAIFWCGLYKYNAFVFENLIGFRDPNSVPIKDFYQPSHNINYLATFITDSNARVRLEFMKNLKIWVCDLDDKYDHHGKLVPYIMSGLFDKDDEVQQTAVNAIQQIGRQIQTEREKDFRQNKQFAIDAAWTWEGKLVDLPLVPPFSKRPSLGSRFFIRGHVRKFWGALYKQVKDISLQNRNRACNLAIYGCIFTENYLTQYLDNMLPNLLPSIIPHQKQDIQCCLKVQKMLFFIGRYCEQSSYIHIMKSALQGQLVQNQQFIKASLRALTQIVAGSLQAVPKDTGLCHKKKQIIQLLEMIKETNTCQEIYSYNAKEIQRFAEVLLLNLQQKATKQQIGQIFEQHLTTLMKVWSVGYYEETYSHCLKIQVDKADPKYHYEPNQQEKSQMTSSQRMNNFFNSIVKLEPKFTEYMQDYLSEVYQTPPSLMDADWKLTLVLNNYFLSSENEAEKILFSLAQQIISESLSFNRSVEILNFCFKYIIHLFKDHDQVISEKNNKEHRFRQLAEILERCLANLGKFKIEKKMAVYDKQFQNKIKKQKQEDSFIPKIKEQTFMTLFLNGSQSLRKFYENKMSLRGQILGRLIKSYIPLTEKSKRSKQCSLQSIKAIWMIFERQNIDQNFPKQILFEDIETKQNVKAIAIIVDFCVSRLQTMMQPEHKQINMLFSILQNILKCIPQFKNAATSLPLIYPEYNQLFQKLIKYAIDEKDVELKQKYVDFLRKASKKMKPWFQLQYKMANEGEKFVKGQFLKNILNV